MAVDEDSTNVLMLTWKKKGAYRHSDLNESLSLQYSDAFKLLGDTEQSYKMH